MNASNRRVCVVVVVVVATGLSAGWLVAPAAAQATRPAATRVGAAGVGNGGEIQFISGVGADGAVRLHANKGAILTTNRPYKRISIGQPDVAEVNGTGPTSMLITARRPGTTQLIVWDDADRSQMVDVVVTADLTGVGARFEKVFPGSEIELTESNGTVILTGRVRDLATAEKAGSLAEPYGQKVLNLLEVAGGQQVMLQVRFAEVSRSATSALGVNFGADDGISIFGSNIGAISPLGFHTTGADDVIDGIGVPQPSSTANIFGIGSIDGNTFAYFIQAMRDNNLLRILAEPNLIAISGQEATFLAGGEFPIPVAQGGAGAGAASVAITIEYREFGVKLRFVPIVLGNGHIRLKVEPEVSDLDFSTAVRFGGFVVPGLSSRKVSTTVELGEGQTLSIAGLLNNSVTSSTQETPLLADVPVLGVLFRSVRYQRKETELVVLVTPRLVEGMKPSEVPPLPGERWRHPTENELFFGPDLGGPAAATGTDTDATAPGAVTVDSSTTRTPPRFYGRYGFTPAARPAAATEEPAVPAEPAEPAQQ